MCTYFQGEKGEQGDPGKKGEPSYIQGPPGPPGTPGTPGYSQGGNGNGKVRVQHILYSLGSIIVQPTCILYMLGRVKFQPFLYSCSCMRST